MKFADQHGLSGLTAGHRDDRETRVSGGTRIIFSDVDGTLLSERGRVPADWGKIRDSLAGALIVLTSSRTVEELLTVQRFLGLHGPVIAENGAILVLSDEWIDRMPAGSVVRPLGVPVRVVHLGSPAVEFRGQVAALAGEHGVVLETEQDVFTPDLRHPRESRRTIARHALARTHSMLLRTNGSAGARERFLTALVGGGLTVTNSGRWNVVQKNSSKGHGVRTFAGLAATVLPQPLQIVGVGDRENDVSLLNVASKRFVMRLANGEVDPMLATTVNATILDTPGVDGWSEIAAVLQTTPDAEGVT